MAHVASVAEVVRIRAVGMLLMVPKALVAEGGTFHEDVEELASVAPQRVVQSFLVQDLEVTNTMISVEGLAVRADVVG